MHRDTDHELTPLVSDSPEEFETLDEALVAACKDLDADGLVSVHDDECDGECEGACEPLIMQVADIMRGGRA